jgi:hypothetical protein
VGTALNKFGEYMSQPGQETDPSGEFPGVTPPSMQQGIIHALRSIGGGKYAAPALRALTDYAQTMSPAGGDVKILPGPNGTSIVTDAMGKGIHIIPKEDTSDQTLSTTFDEDPITGARFASRGKVLASSGYNPKAAAGVQPVLVHDQNGRAIGFNQTDLRGHTVYHPTQAFDPAKDSENNIIPGWYSDGKRMYDTRALLEKQLGVQPGTNAPAAARPAAKPAAKPAAAPSGKIIVQRMEGKTMKQYKLPKEQKADAIKAGYTVVSE